MEEPFITLLDVMISCHHTMSAEERKKKVTSRRIPPFIDTLLCITIPAQCLPEMSRRLSKAPIKSGPTKPHLMTTR